MASAVAMAAFVLAMPAAARATTYTVTSTADGAPLASNCTNPMGNSCRLRDAIQAANSGGTDDLINIQSGLFIGLSEEGHDDVNALGDLDMQTGASGSLEIAGLGTGATIDGPPVDRVFDNIGADSSPVTMSNLTVQDGNPQTAAGNDGGLFAGGEPAATSSSATCSSPSARRRTRGASFGELVRRQHDHQRQHLLGHRGGGHGWRRHQHEQASEHRGQPFRGDRHQRRPNRTRAERCCSTGRTRTPR